jgi:hypothetical protein
MASSQPKSQSSYAVASSCVFVTPFDSTKVRDCCLEQFSVASNYDTGLNPYFFGCAVIHPTCRILATKFGTSSCVNS